VGSALLPQPFHRDPADQLLVAIARVLANLGRSRLLGGEPAESRLRAELPAPQRACTPCNLPLVVNIYTMVHSVILVIYFAI
jgi:hypothetical protein